MAYTREKPRIAPDSEELRRTIPGWGVDLDPADRPSYPKEEFQETGAHWEFPERQPERMPREKSTEHKFLTPVFGTAQPLRGLSGAIRRFAYTFSEGQTAHWLLLMAGDRVDVLEGRVSAALSGRPDNVISGNRRSPRVQGRRVPHPLRAASRRSEASTNRPADVGGALCGDRWRALYGVQGPVGPSIQAVSRAPDERSDVKGRRFS